jgi:CheY-like chemotaxis protein
MTVLVVDDDPFVRMAAAATLQEAGYEVTEASNADEALRALDNGELTCGALVTDIQMPGQMNGCALARRVNDLIRRSPSS